MVLLPTVTVVIKEVGRVLDQLVRVNHIQIHFIGKDCESSFHHFYGALCLEFLVVLE